MWYPICRIEDLPTEGKLESIVNGREVLVFNIDGAYHVVEASCTVDGARLRLESSHPGILVCPHTQAQYDIRTGIPLTAPPYEPLLKYSVRVRDGILEAYEDPS